MSQTIAARTGLKVSSTYRKIMILLFFLPVFTVSVQAENPGMSLLLNDFNNEAAVKFEESAQTYQRDTVSVEELLTWDRWGNGYFGNFRNRSVQMTEDSHSGGIMLISPESYGKDVVVTYDVMTLRPATVLVVMLSSSDGDGTGNLTIPSTFNGALSTWPEGTTDYIFAFHNAPHSRKPFVNRRGTDGVTLLEEAERNYMSPGIWHRIEVGRSGGRVWLKIDGETILDATDQNPIDSGHLAFRIRGSGTERASCFIKNTVIRTPSSR